MRPETAILLAWPDKGLSPNARLHYHALARLKAAAREEAMWSTKAAIPIKARQAIAQGDEPIRLTLTFIPPDRRPRDADNCIASLKAALDGIADALGVDDRRFQPTYEFRDPAKPGGVVVTL